MNFLLERDQRVHHSNHSCRWTLHVLAKINSESFSNSEFWHAITRRLKFSIKSLMTSPIDLLRMNASYSIHLWPYSMSNGNWLKPIIYPITKVHQERSNSIEGRSSSSSLTSLLDHSSWSEDALSFNLFQHSKRSLHLEQHPQPNPNRVSTDCVIFTEKIKYA